MLRFLTSKRLSADDYYDVVIFGFLRAVYRYLDDDNLQRYKFSTIAWSCMNSDLCAHRRKASRMKRQAETVSIYSGVLDSYTAAGYGSQQYLEFQFLMQDLDRQLTPDQREVLWLRLRGDSIREISQVKKIPMKNVQSLLDGIGTILKQLLKK